MTPDDLCKSGKEHGEQTALFCWAACAAKFGFAYAGDDLAYDHRTRGSLSFHFGPSYTIPELERLHAIHNQGHGDAVRGARAKAEGVRAGVPDIFLPAPKFHHGFAGLYVELKQTKYRNAKNMGLTGDQPGWIDYLRLAGYKVEIAFGWREAAAAIMRYVQL